MSVLLSVLQPQATDVPFLHLVPFLGRLTVGGLAKTVDGVLIALADRMRRVEWHLKEGETFEPIKHVATVRGKARHILLGERVALNMLARCSGIATKCVSSV